MSENPSDPLPHPARNPDSPSLATLVTADLAAFSHPGKVRDNNEDHFLTLRLGRDMEVLQSNLPPENRPPLYREIGYGMLVADGMGGAAAGEVASRTVLQSLVEANMRYGRWNLRVEEHTLQEVRIQLERFYRSVNTAITQMAQVDPDLAGMGTTLPIAFSAGDDLFVGNVGDSRAYLFRAGGLTQLTRDQTIVQALLDRGDITPEQAARHPMRHILTGAIGGHFGQVKAEFLNLKLVDGDLLLLCTDGLSDMVDNPGLEAVLQQYPTPGGAGVALIDLALARGGQDNVTAVLARYRIPVA